MAERQLPWRAVPRPETSVHRITGASRSLTEDVQSRQRRYLISMGIRTVCFVLAVVVPGWWRVVFVAGALILPYVSVVFANAGRERATEGPGPIAPPTRLAIEPRPADRQPPNAA